MPTGGLLVVLPCDAAEAGPHPGSGSSCIGGSTVAGAPQEYAQLKVDISASLPYLAAGFPLVDRFFRKLRRQAKRKQRKVNQRLFGMYIGRAHTARTLRDSIAELPPEELNFPGMPTLAQVDATVASNYRSAALAVLRGVNRRSQMSQRAARIFAAFAPQLHLDDEHDEHDEHAAGALLTAPVVLAIDRSLSPVEHMPVLDLHGQTEETMAYIFSAFVDRALSVCAWIALITGKGIHTQGEGKRAMQNGELPPLQQEVANLARSRGLAVTMYASNMGMMLVSTLALYKEALQQGISFAQPPPVVDATATAAAAAGAS
ncbi:hypothetical protein JKP88DRAFT_247653 [Tribonema minus]|uniref:Uncharacterized protein n=1 Tax=Tribonema minus TaxID=303371 RepID=A0A836CBC2_9STRA|nr:hypothetical protein JKP88DRAFT_247653 [Tribonema minus]